MLSSSNATTTTIRPKSVSRAGSLATIGVAPSRPFEFIILRVGRAHNQFEISEASAGASGLEVF